MHEATPRLLRLARGILADGGDPSPCELGTYCIRCALSQAKGELDQLGVTERWNPWMATSAFAETESDRPLVEARKLVAERDKGIAHSRESALLLMDSILSELQ